MQVTPDFTKMVWLISLVGSFNVSYTQQGSCYDDLTRGKKIDFATTGRGQQQLYLSQLTCDGNNISAIEIQLMQESYRCSETIFNQAFGEHSFTVIDKDGNARKLEIEGSPQVTRVRSDVYYQYTYTFKIKKGTTCILHKDKDKKLVYDYTVSRCNVGGTSGDITPVNYQVKGYFEQIHLYRK